MEIVFSEERNTLVLDHQHSSSRHVQQICLQEGGLYMSVYTTAPFDLTSSVNYLIVGNRVHNFHFSPCTVSVCKKWTCLYSAKKKHETSFRFTNEDLNGRNIS